MLALIISIAPEFFIEKSLTLELHDDDVNRAFDVLDRLSIRVKIRVPFCSAGKA